MQCGALVGKGYEELTCWELVRYVYRESLNIELPDLSAEVRPQDRHEWLPVKRGEERFPDVLVFREPGGKHVGVVQRRGRMLHSRRATGVVIERYDGITWKSRLIGIYRHSALA